MKSPARSVANTPGLTFGLIALLFLCGVLISFGSHSAFLLNSDALYLPSLLESLRRGQDLRLFAFPPAPYLFPDLLLHLLCAAFAPALLWAEIGVAAAQICLFIFAASGLAKRSLKEVSATQTIFILAPFAIWLLAEQRFDIQIFTLALISAHHFSLVLLSLWCLIAAFAAREKKGRARQALLAALVILGAVSDPLFLPYFVLPVLCALLSIRSIRNEGGARISIGVSIGAAVGVFVYAAARHLLHFVVIPPETSSRAGAMALAAHTLISDLAHNPALIPAYAYGIIASIVALRARSTWNMRVLCVFLLWLVAASLLTPIVLTFYRAGAERYLMPGAVLSLLIGQLVVSGMLREKGRVLAYANATILILAFAVLPYGRADLSFEDALLPPIVRCLDARLTELHAKRGVGDYWLAKQVSYFSRIGLKADEVREDFGPFHHLNSLEQYVDPATHKGWDYDFIILRKLNVGRAIQLFGPPDFSFWCARSAIWVYRNPRHLAGLQDEVLARIAEISRSPH